jgi:glycosyltransferase involved in cell wall biosynthesis
LYEAFLPHYPENLLLIPNTIDLEMYPYHPRNLNGPRLLWVRSFSKIYNPKMAIDVFAFLKRDFPNAELCMVGPDKENTIEKYIQYSKDLGLEVTFTGKLPKEEWIARAVDFDIFINTTHFDNTPVSVIEAMALGLPVVSTNVGGVPFLIESGKHGILVEDSDTIGMVNAIRQLLNDPQLVRFIQKNARAKVSHYDWQVVKNFWLALLS